MKTILLLIMIAATVGGTYAQRAKSGLLSASEAKKLAKQCSRPSPDDFTATWEPSVDQIKSMEVRVRDISELKVKSCCIVSNQIENPEAWYLQYAALVWKGKKIIYISAVSRSQPTDFSCETIGGKLLCKEGPSDDWKKYAVVICDGGTSWGVIYDVASSKFSDLAINGI